MAKLTVDHFHPQARGGSDDYDNLLYCCNRCNQYKADYWAKNPTDPVLWNPREHPAAVHLLLLADGTLYPITPVGSIHKFSGCDSTVHRWWLTGFAGIRKPNQCAIITLPRTGHTAGAIASATHLAFVEEHHTLLEELQAVLRLMLPTERVIAAPLHSEIATEYLLTGVQAALTVVGFLEHPLPSNYRITSVASIAHRGWPEPSKIVLPSS